MYLTFDEQVYRMDSLTHLVLGAAIGEAVLGKKIGRKAMLWGALADTIPDFDVFGACCNSDAQQLLVHRGITHSFLFVLIMAPLLGYLFNRLFRRQQVGARRWTLLFFLGLLTHILLDSLTSYGTGWFEPFSSYRVSFDTIFVADPFYTLPFLVCVLIALIAKNGSLRRTRWNRIGLILSSLYLIFTMLNHWHINSLMKSSFVSQGYSSDEFVVTPTPLNNFLWMAYTHDSTGAYFGYHSVFDDDSPIKFYKVYRKESLLSPFEKDPQLALLKQFSKGQYIVSTHDSAVFFNDVRFGQLGGWNGPDSSFVFSFRLDRGAENHAVLSRTKFKTSFSEAFASLVKRIEGN